jgi:hypothetical protein
VYCHSGNTLQNPFIYTFSKKYTNADILRGYCGQCNKKVFNTQAIMCVYGVYSHDDKIMLTKIFIFQGIKKRIFN